MKYGLVLKSTGALIHLQEDEDTKALAVLAEAINASTDQDDKDQQVLAVRVQYIMLCAWCKPELNNPLQKLRGSHGCCLSCKVAVMQEIAEMNAARKVSV